MKGSVAVALVVVLASGSAWAELDKKQAGALKRAGNFISNLRAQIEKAKTDQFRFTQRQADELKTRIERAAGDLAKLPADDDGVKTELANLDQVRALLAEQQGALNAAEGARADNVAAITALFTAPEFAADEALVASLSEAFDDAGLLAPDSYLFARWTTHSDLAKLKANVKAWPQLDEKYAALRTKYESCSQRVMVGGPVDMKRTQFCLALGELTKGYERFKPAIDTFRAKGPEQVEKDGATLQQAVDAAVKASDANAFLDPDGRLATLRNRVLNVASVWAGAAPSEADANKLLDRARALDEGAEQSMQKLSEAIITGNKGPKALYAGADAAEVEQFVRGRWAKDFPKESIVAVRFVASAFERRTRWEWDPTVPGFVKRDESLLPGWVVVKDGSDRAIMWPITVFRLHLKGDALALQAVVRGSKISPNRRLLLKNL